MLLSGICIPANGQTAPVPAISSGPPGDRVICQIKNLDQWIPAALSREGYRIGPGDTISVNVQGKASWKYQVRPDAGADVDPNEVQVTPGGDIYLPLLGKIRAAGKSVVELEDAIRTGLSKYVKSFDVAVAVSRVRTVNVWISGEVENPGPQILPAVSTVSLAVLQAGIKPTGSTRRITLIRGATRRTVDLYKMTITGNLEDDIPLEPGDSVHVPPVASYVEAAGELTRPGRFEMVGMGGGSDNFRSRDLTALALGTTPAAALDKAFVEQIGEDGKKIALDVNLRRLADSPDDNPVLQPGDRLVVPSISAFQPMIRLIGEFKGSGVYQRAPGETETDIENKTGIYYLKQGQTVRDVIIAVGGVTPQADLKRARIERKESGAPGGTRIIPVDLERLLNNDDKSADVALMNGDTLILPAVADKIHVFGEVKSAGSYVYSPNRRLVDYLGDAGGPTERAKLTEISVVRVTEDTPKALRFDVKRAIRGAYAKGNPELEPGDIVYVPSKIIAGWRDAVQIIITGLTLTSLLTK
ncbi:MAG TPA: SLBB domain-containing protein [Armatimonadota bacterium]|nr:SLBB domain-containing protein [Armatimonadota bacterium]